MKVLIGNPKEIAAYERALKDGTCGKVVKIPIYLDTGGKIFDTIIHPEENRGQRT